MNRLALSVGLLLVSAGVAQAWTYSVVDDPWFSSTGAESQLRRYKSFSEGQEIVYTNTSSASIRWAKRTHGANGYSDWTQEAVDFSGYFFQPALAVDTLGAPYVTYSGQPDGLTNTVHFAKRVGNGSGNCGTLSSWQCETIATMALLPSPGPVTPIEVYGLGASSEVHIVYSVGSSLHYRKKVGSGSFGPSAVYGFVPPVGQTCYGYLPSGHSLAVTSSGTVYVTAALHCSGGIVLAAGWVNTLGGSLAADTSAPGDVWHTAVVMNSSDQPVVAVGTDSGVWVRPESAWEPVFGSPMETVSLALDHANADRVYLAFSDGSHAYTAVDTIIGYFSVLHPGSSSMPSIIFDPSDGALFSYWNTGSGGLYIAND